MQSFRFKCPVWVHRCLGLCPLPSFFVPFLISLSMDSEQRGEQERLPPSWLPLDGCLFPSLDEEDSRSRSLFLLSRVCESFLCILESDISRSFLVSQFSCYRPAPDPTNTASIHCSVRFQIPEDLKDMFICLLFV